MKGRLFFARSCAALLSPVASDPSGEGIRRASPERTDGGSSRSITGRSPLVTPHHDDVSAIRRLYRGSAAGNAGNRGLDDDFAKLTYVPTLLDSDLLPRIVAAEFDLVLLSGNPGDGKTSVLVKLGEQLRERGATEEASDEAGWRLRLNGHLFISVFDASEAHGSLTSDELVRQALDPVVAGDSATALIAVNDGRLLQFFTDHEDDYEQLWWAVQDQLEGKDPVDSRVALVDLNAARLPRHTASRVWPTAHWQLSRTRACGGFARAAVRTRPAPSRQPKCLSRQRGEAFGELILVSHLRRRRRATFRDVRSASAWLITGDRSCADIHALEAEGFNPRFTENALVRDLAFAPQTDDYLIEEWSHLDPSAVAARSVDGLRRAMNGEPTAPLSAQVSAVARALLLSGDRVGRRSSRRYPAVPVP